MAVSEQKLYIMRDEKISKALIKMGVPTMVGMLISALYSVVDTYFVGNLGTSQMGAVSVVFPIVQIIIGLGMTFGSGAASYISRLLGEGSNEKANRTASTALFSSIFFGIAVIILSLSFLDKLLLALGATVSILPYAREYAYIYVSGSILNIFNVTMNNIITAEGRAKLTMLSMFVGGGMNVLLDPLFIYSLKFGVGGAAIATVISQAITSCIYLWFIMGKKGYLRFSIKLFTFEKRIFSEILKIGIPILVFQILASTAMGLSNTVASKYGDSAVAAVGVVARIMTLGTYVVFGYMKGFQPLAGYNYGAKQYKRMIEATQLSLKWSTIFCSIVAVFMIIFPSFIISLFNANDSEFIRIGTMALRASGVIFPFYGFEMVYMSLFLAMGKGKEGSILSISRQGLFFIPTIFILPNLFGVQGIIWAQPTADLLTVLLTWIFAIIFHKNFNKLVKN